MSLEQRMEALEGKYADLQTRFDTAIEATQLLGGRERVFQAAILAIIRHHPDKASLREALPYFAERALVDVHFNAQHESHLRGAEQAREVILEHLNTP